MNLFRRLMQAAPDDGAVSGGADHSIPSTPSEDMRATLEKAFEASEKPAAPTDRTAPTEQRTTDKTAAVRAPDGTFAKAVAKTAAEADAQVGGIKPTETPEVKPPENQETKPLEAPRSWKPGAREQWGSLTPEVQQEVLRRESEVYRFAQNTAQARQIADNLSQMGQQFAPALQAEGVDVLTATQNLMGMVSRLRFGTPMERATTIAGLIEAYGVDLPTLDQHLAAKLGGQPAMQQQPQQFQDPRVDQLLSSMQIAQQQREQQTVQAAVNEVVQFGQGKDFFQDVRQDMADILDMAARRGIDMPLEQAYDRACRMNPEIFRIISQREAAASAQNGSPSTERNKLAASSVRSTPATPPRTVAAPANLRDDLEAAWGDASTRGR
jgi:hypothetical protein